MKKKILITGVSGYIGSCLYYFLQKEYNLFTIDKKYPPSWLKLNIKKFYKINLNNSPKLNHILQKIRPDVIIHLAGLSTVNEKINKKKYRLDNIEATKNLLAVMKKNNIEKLIFSSTAAVYKKTKNKIKEGSRKLPLNNYGISKLKTEKIILKEKKIKSIILRFFNVASSIIKYKIGECHIPETHLIPNFVSRIRQKKPVYIYGSNYKTKDGTCIRDYIHIIDICDAIKKSINYLFKNNSNSQIFNLGNEKGLSVKEVLNKIQSILKKKARILHKNNRKGDPENLVCEIKKAKKILGWRPKKSSLNKIITDDILWNEFLIKKRIFRI